MKFSALPAVNDGCFLHYEVPRQYLLGYCRKTDPPGHCGARPASPQTRDEMLQLSVDGQTGQMGQTGPDGMEWAIPTRILTSRARGLPAKGIDSAQSRLQYHLALRDPYLPVRQDGVDLPKLQKPRPQRLTSRCRGWLPAQAPALGFSSEPYQLCLCSLCHWHVRFCWRKAIK